MSRIARGEIKYFTATNQQTINWCGTLLKLNYQSCIDSSVQRLNVCIVVKVNKFCLVNHNGTSTI